MSLQHDIAKRARRRAAAERSRERRDLAHLTIDQARVCWWFAAAHRPRSLGEHRFGTLRPTTWETSQ